MTNLRSFEDYEQSFDIKYNTSLLDLSIRDNEYVIFEGSHPLKTPLGNFFSHSSERFVRLLLTDLQISGTNMQLSSATSQKHIRSQLLYCFFKDVIAAGEDPLNGQWNQLFESDPFVLMKTTGKSNSQPFDHDVPLFDFSLLSLTGLLETVNLFAGKIMGEISLDDSESNPFPLIIKQYYLGLAPEQKAVIQALIGVHKSGIVLPLLLVAGELTSVEYVNGLISLRIKEKELFSEILTDTSIVNAFLVIPDTKSQHGKNTLAIIKEGEGDSIEFKSTLRWDIRAGKTNPAIEHSCLKTIAAFLNTSGGTLLIGVRDDGSIEGIETDKLPNEDKFLLHLWTLIRTCLGRDFSPYVRTRLEKIDDKTICSVICIPSNRPVFLRQNGFPEEMYIRVGPSSNAMDISEALKYIGAHFNEKL